MKKTIKRKPTFTIIFLILLTSISGCNYKVDSEIVLGTAGSSGSHTPIFRNSQGNMFGYFEYLPIDFDPEKIESHPLIIYWNGANAIAGNGKDELDGVLSQGLPKNINEGEHYPAIIISAQMKYDDWKTIDIHPFVEYILTRYQNSIDLKRIYMTGFSAGGGLTMRYTMENPGALAAIVPIAPAIRFPEGDEGNNAINNIPTWIFHNESDEVVSSDRSIEWHDVLEKNQPNTHKLTIYPVEGHYALITAYKSNEMWEWLLSKQKSKAVEK